MGPLDTPATRRPSAWAVVLALALAYTSWGTTYFAIREGVKEFPPALFGGARITLAGIVLWLYLACTGRPVRLPLRELFWTALAGCILFVGGNGLITVAEQTVQSGEASVLAATTPLWMVLLELLWPWGERLTLRGWLGLLLGLGGVLVVLPLPHNPADLFRHPGPFLVLSSAFCWGLGSFLLRRRRRRLAPLTSATYQMILGGGALAVLGLLTGEAGHLGSEHFTAPAVCSFFYLLVVGSLVGFLAYTWLLHHVSAALAGTYAYVNPVVAVIVGAVLGGEMITLPIVGGMAVILAGVALVRREEARAGAERGTRSAEREQSSEFHALSSAPGEVSVPVLADDGGELAEGA
jgi:drug/metabolite transporter (DMT)-like permease